MTDQAPDMRILAGGDGWQVAEFICRAGPHDRPFEEQHDHVAISAVVEGTFNYRTDSGNALLHPGAFLLGNPGRCFQCGHDHGTGDRCIAVRFAADYFAEISASSAGSADFSFSAPMLPALPALLPLFVTLEAQAAAPDPLQMAETAVAVAEAVIGTAAGTGPTGQSASAADERRIARALRHIESAGAEPLTLEELAAAAGMSKYHFLRVFRRVVGVSPYQQVLGQRLRHAALRLLRSRERVAEIAYDTGFGDLSTFNGRFRGVFGQSPQAFRRRHRG